MRYYPQCQQLIHQKRYQEAFGVCSQILGTVLGYAGNINFYDVRKKCTYPPLCYDFSSITKYLNQG